MVRRVEQTMAMATAMRARLDDRIGFNFDNLMVTESMLPEEQERMLRYSGGIEAVEPPEFLTGGTQVKLRSEDDLARELERSRAAELTGDLLYIDDRSGTARADCGAGQGRRVKTRIATVGARIKVWVSCTGMVEHV